MNASYRTRFVAAALVMVGTAGPTAAGKPAGPFHVTTTVYDTDAMTGATLQLQSDVNAAGPGSATYQSDSTGVKSVIEATGQSDWVLDLRSNTAGRVVSLTLETPAGEPLDGFPSGPSPYAARVLSRCFHPAGGASSTVSWFAIVGSNPNCSLRVGFVHGSTNYVLVMSPAAQYAGTGLVQVFCTGYNGPAACVDWTVMPNPIGDNAGLAKLFSVDRRGNETYVATSLLTFRIHVSYP